MATFTWTAGSGNFSTTSDWFDSTGNTSAVPGTFDTAILPGSSLYTVTMDVDATINNLVMTDVQATLAIGTQTFSVLASGTAATIDGKVTLGSVMTGTGGNFDGNSGSLSSGAASRISGFGNVSFASITGAGIFEASVSGQTLTLSGAMDASVTGMRVDAGATLEIGAGGVAAGATVTFKSGASGTTLSLPGGIASGEVNAFSGTIAGMTVGTALSPTGTNEIDLTTVADGNITSASLNTTTDVITVNTSGGNFTLQLSGSYSAGTNVLHVADSGSGSDLFLSTACYCRGTRILSPKGEVPVEDLAVGDLVVTWAGEAHPIKWIGRRRYDGRFIAGNKAVLPICVTAGALFDGVPARDLWVSPEHALYLGEVLVPARLLVNGATIVQPRDADRVDYFHIELEAHDIIVADGAPAETYVDCGNRLVYQNAGEFAALYPDDARPPWQFCAPRLKEMSHDLLAIRAAVLARAAALGHRLDGDPDLHLVVDGTVVAAQSVEGRRHRFILPAGARSVWLASRVAAPAEVDPAVPDWRPLGISLEMLVLSDATLRIEIGHDFAGLTDGFHADEGCHRWTAGLARLPEALLAPFAGAVTLDVHRIESALRYRRTRRRATAPLQPTARWQPPRLLQCTERPSRGGVQNGSQRTGLTAAAVRR